MTVLFAAVLEEKAAALHALGCYAEQCPQAFEPFIEKTLELVLNAAVYFHEIVREEAYTALAQILKAAVHHYPPNNGACSSFSKRCL